MSRFVQFDGVDRRDLTILTPYKVRVDKGVDTVCIRRVDMRSSEKGKLVIERDKWYYTRGGEKVRVICIDAPDVDYPIVAIDEDLVVYTYDANGYSRGPDNKHVNDIVREARMLREFSLCIVNGEVRVDNGLGVEYQGNTPPTVEYIRVREVLDGDEWTSDTRLARYRSLLQAGRASDISADDIEWLLDHIEELQLKLVAIYV